MRVNYQRDVKHTGTLDVATRQKMTIDENSLQHLMSLLTDIYSDPLMAVIREYALNAYDSHKAAGNDDPIEVELPNDMRPTYIVRDRGLGMSVDEVLNHLSKYGASSKRETDSEVGMLGIGFKAALTYTSQFTLTSIKDGVKAVVLVARDDDGVGSIQIVDTVGTDEPNGVEVQVPVSNIHHFNKRANWFFRFWENDSVLVNGELPEPIIGDWLDDDVVLVDHEWNYAWGDASSNQEYLVMGNIPYPIEENKRLCPVNNKRAIVWVPMGAVNFVPSREALHYTDLTNDTLGDARWWIAKHFQRIAQEDVASAPDYKEAYLRAHKWMQMNFRSGMGRGGQVQLDLLYHNQSPPDYVRFPGNDVYKWHVYDNVAVSDTTVKFSDLIGLTHYHDGRLKKVVHVVNHPNKNWAGINRRKFKKYCEENDIEISSYVYIYEPRIAHPWLEDFDNITFIDFDDIRDVDVGSGSAGGDDESASFRLVHVGEGWDDKSRKRLYDQHMSGFRVNFVKEISLSTPTFYFSPTELAQWSNSIPIALDVPDDVNYVLLNKNRWTKFTRDDAPHAEHLFDALGAAAAEFVRDLTNEELLALNGAARWTSSAFSVLPHERVVDPGLAEFIKAFSDVSDAVRTRWRAFGTMHRASGEGFDLPELPKSDFDALLRKYNSKYPLAVQEPAYIIAKHKEELITYVNARYKQDQHNQYLEQLQLTQPDDEE